MFKTDPDDPISLFAEWYAEAANCGLSEPTAVALASADINARPSVRMVLLKSFDSEGYVFYTNLESRKGRELIANPHAALCFFWMPIDKQVRVEGTVTIVSDAEADAYFASRGRDSQIGAWASPQSRPLESRVALEKRVAVQSVKFAVGKVSRPQFWSGFRLRPECIEFWRKMPFRLHDRLSYRRTDEGWSLRRLYP